MDNRERIIIRAAELFKKYGIRSVTMDSLAAELGMSKRTIYEVFSDKDELLVGVLNWMAVKQRDITKKVLDESTDAIAAIFVMLEMSRDHIQGISPAFQADLKKYHQDVLMNKVEKCEMPDYSNNIEVIRRGIKEKLFRDDINPDIVNRCLYELGKTVMDQDLYPYELFSRREVMKNIFINYLRGIATHNGLKQINSLALKF
jgi:TetR/AcrR family transcriptional regulator, cholesterol catabolism regulator